nr:MAG TPA: hypothetical protein [Caudoviricetes sp.]
MKSSASASGPSGASPPPTYTGSSACGILARTWKS